MLNQYTAIGLLLALGIQTAVAQSKVQDTSTEIDLGTKVPDPAVIYEGLFPLEHCEELVQSKQFKCMVGVKPTVTFSLPAVAFAFGSAVLPESLKRQLDVFAEVLRTKGAATKHQVRIVGHADSSGSDAGNKLLSEKRAQAVKLYLVNKGADSKMLATDGVGSTKLLKPEAPTSPENRRVTLGR